MNISIQAVQFTADQKLVEFIEKRIAKLQQYFDRITSVEVYLKLENKSTQIKDKTVSIRCNIPGSNFYAEDTTAKFEASVDEVVDSLTRQIKKHKTKLHRR